MYAFYPGVKASVDDWAVNTFGEQAAVAWNDFSVGMTNSIFWTNYITPNLFAIGIFTGMAILGGFIMLIKPHLPTRKVASATAATVTSHIAQTPLDATTRPEPKAEPVPETVVPEKKEEKTK